MGAATQHLRFRDVMLGLIQAALDCRRAILKLAGEHTNTVMPGYTHLQPAQPITLGHYLTAIESALVRDTARLWGALERCDLCPLGAAALAGTGFPISRERTAELLGFPGLVVNTLDAVASRFSRGDHGRYPEQVRAGPIRLVHVRVRDDRLPRPGRGDQQHHAAEKEPDPA
jgi:argininosuccinate lyase